MAEEKLNKSIQRLVDNIGQINSGLADQVKNVRLSSRDTFQGVLNSRSFKQQAAKLLKDDTLIKLSNSVKQSQQQFNIAQQKLKDELVSDKFIGELKEKNKSLLTSLEDISLTNIKRAKLQDEYNKNIEDINSKRSEIENRYQNELQVREEMVESANKEYQKAESKRIKSIEEAAEGGQFSKFSDGVKEITGGLVDIADVLDTGVKKFNAVKDIAGALLSPFAGLFQSSRQLTKAQKQQAASMNQAGASIEGVSEAAQIFEGNVAEVSLISEDATKGLGRFAGNLLLTLAPLLLLGAGLLLFGDRLKKFVFPGQGTDGVNETTDNLVDLLQKKSQKELESKGKDFVGPVKPSLTQEEVDKFVVPLEQRLEKREKSDNIVGVDNQLAAAAASTSADALNKVGAKIVDDAEARKEDRKVTKREQAKARNAPPPKSSILGPDGKPIEKPAPKPKGFFGRGLDKVKLGGLDKLDDVAAGTGKALQGPSTIVGTNQSGLLGKASKLGGGPLQAGVAVFEAFKNLQDTKLMEAERDRLVASGELSGDNLTTVNDLIAREKLKDVLSPALKTAGSVTGGAAGVGLGLFAGPAAPVVSPILGIIGSILGNLGADKVDDKVLDYFLSDTQGALEQFGIKGEDAESIQNFIKDIEGMGPTSSDMIGEETRSLEDQQQENNLKRQEQLFFNSQKTDIFNEGNTTINGRGVLNSDITLGRILHPGRG